VDSGVRMKESDRTAYIFAPGGLGTADELFEVLTLVGAEEEVWQECTWPRWSE
jgi:predicted Rossmann-fold nucleotide-binding protein